MTIDAKNRIRRLIRPFQQVMQLIIGVTDITYRLEQEISSLKEADDAIFYYLNNYLLEAKNLPPTKDADLRIMQLCDAELLRIVDKILTKHNLTYWLDFGTLLGAVRHKGFIPWDDDMDMAVPEETYYETFRVLKEELLHYPGFSCYEEPNSPYNRICIGYYHQSTGIWLDIFCYCSVPYVGEKVPFIKSLEEKIWDYKQEYLKVRGKWSVERIDELKKQVINCDDESVGHLYFFAPERNPYIINKIYFEDQDLYPLVEVEFENYKFKAPANYELFLNQHYSNSYMQLARNGILRHDEGRTPLSTWAKQHNVDMNEKLLQLKSVCKSI